MNKIAALTLSAGFLVVVATATSRSAHAEPSLTIYNQNFAVIRDTLPLDLKPGINRVQLTDTTAQLEPGSVVLRDPSGQHPLQITEQFYRADPISQGYLLSLLEGKTIDFRVQRGDTVQIVKGKIIRSGYVPVTPGGRYSGGVYYDNSGAYAGSATGQPLIEVDGQLRFSLPGEPLFPALPEDAILKPTLNWVIQAETGGPLKAELGYVTGGMSWKADYNIVAPENGNVLDLTGWVTLTNTCGKTFENARIKLMAGDVSKIQPNANYYTQFSNGAMNMLESRSSAPSVTERTFDEYHLYTLDNRTTLRDRETKQVEFARVAGIKSTQNYLYDGAKIDRDRYSGWNYENIRQDQNYGTQSNSKIVVMREFANTRENGLGIPLPQGRLRFYRRDADGQLEFTGENTINHTPQGEVVRIYTGNAFDLVGERKRTAYKIDSDNHVLDETFEIRLRNRKAAAVEVRVIEHLYRGENWTIPQKTNALLKTDANTVEFRVQVPPDGEKLVSYTVHYTW